MDSHIAKKMENLTVVIPAAGRSSRMKGRDKLLAEIRGIPLIQRTLMFFFALEIIPHIILVSSEENFPFFTGIMEKFDSNRLKKLVPGGKSRQESVYNGVRSAQTGFIAVHDGARPFLCRELFYRLVSNVSNEWGCIPGLPLTDTVKTVNEGIVTGTPPRGNLFRVQTPQVFPAEMLCRALESAVKNNIQVTDEAQAVEMAGGTVKLVPGSWENIKITNREDMDYAEFIVGKE